MKQGGNSLTGRGRRGTPSGAWCIQNVLSVLAMAILLSLLGGTAAQAAAQTNPVTGGLKVRAPVVIAGVKVGEVEGFARPRPSRCSGEMPSRSA